MGGNEPRRDPNVIIPDIGAAKYWYVDPRASGSGSMPVGHSNLEQQALYRTDPNRYSPPHEDQAQIFDAVQRLMLPKDSKQFQAQSDAQRQRDRQSVYGTIGIKIDGEELEVPLWHKGMTAAQAEDAARMRFEHDLSAFAPEWQLEAAQNENLFKRLQLQPQNTQPGF